MASIDFALIGAADPWTSYPAGWQRTSSYAVRVTTQSSVNYFSRSTGTGQQMGCLVNSAPITGNTLVVKRVHATNATTSGTTSQCVMHNSSGNGYVLEQDQAGTTTTFKLLIAWVVQTTALQTFTSYGTGYSQQFELWCVDKSAGTFQFRRNGVQVGSNFTDTTYTGLEYGGVGSTGGRTRSIEVGELFDVLTLTDPIVAGQPFSGTCVGSTDGAGTLTAGGLAVPMTVAGGGTTFSGTWPLPADDTLYPVMNSASINFTWAKDGNSEVLARAFNAPAGTAVTQFGTMFDKGLTGGDISRFSTINDWSAWWGNNKDAAMFKQAYEQAIADETRKNLAGLGVNPTDADVRFAARGLPDVNDFTPKNMMRFLIGTEKGLRIKSALDQAKSEWEGQNGSLGVARQPLDVNINGQTIKLPAGTSFTTVAKAINQNMGTQFAAQYRAMQDVVDRLPERAAQNRVDNPASYTTGVD